jgi:hypothetical protein
VCHPRELSTCVYMAIHVLVCMQVCIHVYIYTQICMYICVSHPCACMCMVCKNKTCREAPTAILIIIEGQFQVFQRFSSSKLVLRTVDSRFTALNHYENGSMYTCMHVCMWLCVRAALQVRATWQQVQVYTDPWQVYQGQRLRLSDRRARVCVYICVCTYVCMHVSRPMTSVPGAAPAALR